MNTIKQFMIDYSRDVVSGEIVACQKHIRASPPETTEKLL